MKCWWDTISWQLVKKGLTDEKVGWILFWGVKK